MSRRLRSEAAVLFSAALLLPAMAVTSPASGNRLPDASPSLRGADGLEPSRHQVTLITGDRIDVETYPNGRSAVSVDPAQRSDGQTPGFHQMQDDGHYYVIPADVYRFVPDRLDLALFDVTGLVEQGYDDKATDELPVLIDYGDRPRRASAEHLPAIATTRSLSSVGAVAASVDKAHAERFGSRVLSSTAADASGGRLPGAKGVDKIWLDSEVTVTDEDSAPQIGAPAAWESGYTGEGVTIAVLDTGIDQAHPDLAGKVVAEANFSDSADVSDHFGHGTHVASIAAGTGAASDGLRKGIAYGAELMNGKVLNDLGSGPLSEVIAGMQWAASNGADVINMSLGVRGLYTDGTDPVSQAVDDLTARYGSLFVIAAGNDGPGDATVTTPGAADDALTVGAVDKADVLAPYSSRGPRAGDFALKPDVTAPGTDIIAARAAGTSLGTPVDEQYTRASGTSMATPHVAGAAALLLQQRPELTDAEIKALLGSSADPGAASVYQQGAGRINLAKAIDATILPRDISLSLGYFPYPQNDDAPVTRTLTYRNLGTTDVSLSLHLDVTDADGAAPADGMLGLSTDSLVVPAGGRAGVEVTVDPSAGDVGLYGGYLTASASDGQVAHTTLGFYKEPERYAVTVKGTTRDGRPAGGISTIDLMNVQDRQIYHKETSFVDGEATFRVPPGEYAAMGYIFTYDEPGVFATEAVAAFEPEVAVEGDTTVELDARDAVPIEIDTKDPTKATHYTLSYYRADSTGGSYTHSYTISPPIRDAFAVPTEAVDMGAFEFYSMWSMPAPDIRITHDGQPVDAEYVFNSAKLAGHFDTEMVYVGLGRPEDYQGLDMHGKIALIRRGELTFWDKIHNAEAAGALAAVIFNHSPGLLVIGGDPESVPTLSMTQTDGEALVEAMDGGALPVTVDAVKDSPYLYELLFPEEDAIPDTMSYVVSKANTAEVTADYRSHVPHHGVGELRHKWRPWEFFSFGFLRQTTAPSTRREYVSSGDTRWAHYAYGYSTPAYPFGYLLQSDQTTYRSGEKLHESWLQQVAVPGFWPAGDDPREATVYRDGPTISMNMPEWGEPGGHWGWADPSFDTTDFRLYEDGQLVGGSARPYGDFAVSTGPATYRLELDVARNADWWTMSTDTRTAWTVQSAGLPAGAAEVLPLLHVDFDATTDMLNRVKPSFPLRLHVSHQPGSTPSPVVGLRVWTSTDDGATWERSSAQRTGPGQYLAYVRPASRDYAHVSLKIEAWDAGGNRIEQEVTRAFNVR